MGLDVCNSKKLNEKNEFVNIPILNFIANSYDKNLKAPSKILFEYLLCQWQHPHPRNFNPQYVLEQLKIKDFGYYIFKTKRFSNC